MLILDILIVVAFAIFAFGVLTLWLAMFLHWLDYQQVTRQIRKDRKAVYE